MSVLCIGQLVADVVVRPVDRLPLPGRANLVEDLQLTAGGCAANTAAVLARLGVDTSIVAVVGKDRLGDAIVAEMASSGVRVDGLVHSGTSATSSVVVLVAGDGERSFLYREGGNEQLTADMVSDEALRSAGYVHIGGAMKLHRLDLAGLLRRARNFGCTTSLDTDWDPTSQWMSLLSDALPLLDYLLTNEEEGGLLSGEMSALDIGRSLLSHGPGTVVVKRGPRGAVVVSHEGHLNHPAYTVPVLDTTCAGDAFAAGFLYGLSNEWCLSDTIKFANATGALCTTAVSHGGVKSIETVEELMAGHQNMKNE
jgi:sugar/nucleoside kinase (ribokinase family)